VSEYQMLLVNIPSRTDSKSSPPLLAGRRRDSEFPVPSALLAKA
jgi:hypothetical protein